MIAAEIFLKFFGREQANAPDGGEMDNGWADSIEKPSQNRNYDNSKM